MEDSFTISGEQRFLNLLLQCRNKDSVSGSDIFLLKKSPYF